MRLMYNVPYRDVLKLSLVSHVILIFLGKNISSLSTFVLLVASICEIRWTEESYVGICDGAQLMINNLHLSTGQN